MPGGQTRYDIAQLQPGTAAGQAPSRQQLIFSYSEPVQLTGQTVRPVLMMSPQYYHYHQAPVLAQSLPSQPLPHVYQSHPHSRNLVQYSIYNRAPRPPAQSHYQHSALYQQSSLPVSKNKSHSDLLALETPPSGQLLVTASSLSSSMFHLNSSSSPSPQLLTRQSSSSSNFASLVSSDDEQNHAHHRAHHQNDHQLPPPAVSGSYRRVSATKDILVEDLQLAQQQQQLDAHALRRQRLGECPIRRLCSLMPHFRLSHSPTGGHHDRVTVLWSIMRRPHHESPFLLLPSLPSALKETLITASVMSQSKYSPQQHCLSPLFSAILFLFCRILSHIPDTAHTLYSNISIYCISAPLPIHILSIDILFLSFHWSTLLNTSSITQQ